MLNFYCMYSILQIKIHACIYGSESRLTFKDQSMSSFFNFYRTLLKFLMSVWLQKGHSSVRIAKSSAHCTATGLHVRQKRCSRHIRSDPRSTSMGTVGGRVGPPWALRENGIVLQELQSGLRYMVGHVRDFTLTDVLSFYDKS